MDSYKSSLDAAKEMRTIRSTVRMARVRNWAAVSNFPEWSIIWEEVDQWLDDTTACLDKAIKEIEHNG